MAEGRARASTDKLVKRNLRQIKQLQEKFTSMHELVVDLADANVVDSDNKYAALSPVEINRVEGAETTVIACAGLITRLGMPPKEFFKSLVDLGCNTIFIKDFRQCWYQQGLMNLSTNIDETAEVLQGILPKGTKSVRFVGTSAGGFAAMQFGIRMGADKILTFSPQTNVAEHTFKKFASPDSRIEDVEFQNADMDVMKAVEAHKEFNGEILVHYSANFPEDARQAKYLESVPNVRLLPHDYDEHGVAGYLRETGKLSDILKDFVA